MSKAACALTPEQADRRGLAWIIGSFAFCPCHLPITLWVAGAVLSGSAAGAVIRGHAWITGAVLGAVWLAGTLYGLNLIRRAQVASHASRTDPHVVPK